MLVTFAGMVPTVVALPQTSLRLFQVSRRTSKLDSFVDASVQLTSAEPTRPATAAIGTRNLPVADLQVEHQAAPGSARLDFASLDNVVMTPHMSGWTHGLIRRRQQTIADNVARLAAGRDLVNVVHRA